MQGPRSLSASGTCAASECVPTITSEYPWLSATSAIRFTTRSTWPHISAVSSMLFVDATMPAADRIVVTMS